MIPDRAPDWSDRHSGPTRAEITSAREAFHLGLAAMPGWAKAALTIRNAVLRPFGFKTEGGTGGDLMSTLPILVDQPDRFEVGLEDKHLTFVLTTEQAANQATITTRIWFNHWFGRLYLLVVMIPHKLILRHAIRRLA